MGEILLDMYLFKMRGRRYLLLNRLLRIKAC